MLTPQLLLLVCAALPVPQEESVADILDAWQANTIPLAQQEFAFARLRGRIDAVGARQLVKMLESPEVPRRNELLQLLLQVPFAVSRPLLLDFARDEARSAEERGRIAEFLLLLDGHAAFEALRDTIRIDAEPPYLRRVFAGWRESIRAEDFELLQHLAVEGKGYPAQYALQLWALHETRSEARQRIFLLARDSDTSYRAAAIEALARKGPDPVIAAMLRAELDGPTPELRRLARRMLPSFSSAEDLLQEYESRAADLSVNLRGRWMVDLAGLPLAAAQRLAMQWLVDGGWNTGSKAQQVVLLLGRSAEVDPLLPVLLHHEDIPQRVLFPLALSRADSSADARAYLLEQLPLVGSVRQMQIVRVFARRNGEKDLQLLRDIVESSAYASAARSLALEMLVAHPQAQSLVTRWLQQPLPQEYELAAAWLRALAASDDPRWHLAAVQQAQTAQGFDDAEEQRGLRVEVWAALGRSGDAARRPRFEQRLQSLLHQTVGVTASGEAWGPLYRLGSEFQELNTVLQGLRQCSMVDAPLQLPLPIGFSTATIPADVLLVAAASLASTHPQTAGRWFRDLLTRELPEVDRLRVLGLMAHRLPLGEARQDALAALLAEPGKLGEWRRAMAEAFAPEGTAWVLFAERLQERALMDAVELGTEEVSALASLVQGYAEDSILARAAEFAATAGETALALTLAARRVDHNPLSDVAHAQLALLLGETGREQEVAAQWRIVLRLAPDLSELWQQARAALGEPSK